MAKRGRGSRIKGATFERQVAKILTKATGKNWQRGLGQTRRGGAEIPDVHSEEEPNIHVECKRQKRCNIKRAIEQAVNDTEGTDKLKVVVTKDDHKPILVTMPIEDWLKLFTKYTA